MNIDELETEPAHSSPLLGAAHLSLSLIVIAGLSSGQSVNITGHVLHFARQLSANGAPIESVCRDCKVGATVAAVVTLTDKFTEPSWSTETHSSYLVGNKFRNTVSITIGSQTWNSDNGSVPVQNFMSDAVPSLGMVIISNDELDHYDHFQNQDAFRVAGANLFLPGELDPIIANINLWGPTTLWNKPDMPAKFPPLQAFYRRGESKWGPQFLVQFTNGQVADVVVDQINSGSEPPSQNGLSHPCNDLYIHIEYDRSNPQYHQTENKTIICGKTMKGCTRQLVFEVMLSDPAAVGPVSPFVPHQHVKDCGYLTLETGQPYEARGYRNIIRTGVYPNTFSVVNYTEPSHMFYPGQVTREIVDENGEIYVHTVGIGTGDFRDTNYYGGTYLIWPSADQTLKLDVEKRLGFVPTKR